MKRAYLLRDNKRCSQLSFISSVESAAMILNQTQSTAWYSVEVIAEPTQAMIRFKDAVKIIRMLKNELSQYDIANEPGGAMERGRLKCMQEAEDFIQKLRKPKFGVRGFVRAVYRWYTQYENS